MRAAQREYARRYYAANKTARHEYRKGYDARPGVREAKREYQREYHATNRAAILESMKKRRAKNTGRERERDLQSRYGIALREWGVMLGQQEGCCAICPAILDRSKHTHVDHCHATGRVRGLLCSSCNRTIGHAKENPERLRAAANYVERYNAP